MVHIHNGLLLTIERNMFELAGVKRMNQEPIKQSEASQKEKNKYRISMNLLTGQQWRNRHREKTYGHGERRGEGEMYGKSNMEAQEEGDICILTADSLLYSRNQHSIVKQLSSN